ncbi:alpha/beta fold hydrolase [Paenibacillus glycanilyticus]|uniref:2-succinyl-6-hydroxy-2,4-cyclohexadiene-1-carboxylate synthase n=1 Tax=Paenibacillus glycanilyticus TaxID=126569 RepID=A0ABQ6G846_9BACL|nr:alpha/beta hydrolase [Paenibacillus glycanilyticus]GLX66455.1 putative 2-succinyl-6-hydroxy-2,4-cyclohexadiene-1-carboxylate synthase [Paenibacillus glycanilyticus]
MMPLEQKSVTLGENAFPYYIQCNADKETIVLLHAAFADYTLFEEQIAYLQDQYQLVVLNLPGHGLQATATTAARTKFTIKDMPDIISGILADNHIESCHLLGVSLGSLVAQAFADRYPQQVQSVIIVGGYSIHKANKRIRKEQLMEGLKWLGYILFSMTRFKQYVLKASCYTEEGRRLFDQGIRHFRRQSFQAMSGMGSFFTDRWKPMPYPMLLLVGEHDRDLIHEAANLLHQLEPRSRLVVLPGAGHCANADRPEAFNQVVGDYLSALFARQ